MPQRVSMKLGDLLPDNPDRDNPGLVKAENVIPHKTSYQPTRDLVAETSALNGLCRGAATGIDKGGVVHNYAGSQTKLYERSGITWTDKSRTNPPSGGDDYSLPSAHNWSFMRFYNLSDGTMNMCAANGSTKIQEQTSFSGDFNDIVPDSGVTGNTDATPALRYIAPVGDFMVGGWLSTNQSLVKWSGIGNHRVWTPGVEQSDEQTLQRGGQITQVVGGEYGVIFCEHSIYRMIYVGSPIVFQFDEVAPGRGTTAPGSVAQYGDQVFFIDSDGFYVFNGSQAVSIGSNRMNDTFLEDYDSEFANRVVSAIDTAKALVWWAYPSKNARYDSNDQKVPDKIMVYDITSGRFAGPINLEVEALTYSQTSTSFLLDDITPTNFPAEATITVASGECYDDGGTGTSCIDADLFDYYSDADIFKGGNVSMAAFNYDHRQATFNGDVLTALLETGEFTLNEFGRALLTGVRPQVDGNAPTIEVRVGSREQPFGPVVWSSYSTPQTRSGLANFRNGARYHRAELTVSGSYHHAFGLDVEFEKAGM